MKKRPISIYRHWNYDKFRSYCDHNLTGLAARRSPLLARGPLPDEDASVFRGFLRTLFGLKRAVLGGAKAAVPVVRTDPRAGDPWVSALLDALGDRYLLGDDKPDGAQVLRRTGRERFNPMLVYLRAAEHAVIGFYEVRGHGEHPAAEARRVLDKLVSAPLAEHGLLPGQERIEEWGGTVLIRRYEGRCDEPVRAAGAVRFMCQESDQVMDTASEGS